MPKQRKLPPPLIPLMSKGEFKNATDKLGFTQGGLARFLGSDVRTVRRLEKGEFPVPAALALSLRLMVRFKVEAPESCRKVTP